MTNLEPSVTPNPVNSHRIFISSVQKELELERAAVAGLISTDPFLLQHCVPVLLGIATRTGRGRSVGYIQRTPI